MKTIRLTENQLTKLKKHGRLWGRIYYYELIEPNIVRYRKIYHYTGTGKKLMTNTYAELNNLFEYAKVK